MFTSVLVVVALMVLNGVFAAAEIAVLSVRKTRLAELADAGGRRARAVRWLRKEPERFLATVQIGLTLAGTAAAAFGGERIAGEFGRWLAHHAPVLGTHARGIGLASVVILISCLKIVVGELVPKSLALRSAERYALLFGPGLRVMATVVRPAVWLLTRISNAVLAAVGDTTSFTEARLSPDELQELVEEAGRVGALDAKTTEITTRAIAFRELVVSEVMVPRQTIVAVARDATPQEFREALGGRRFSRVPVYAEQLDNIVGYVAVKDALGPLIDGSFVLGKVIRPVEFVPRTMAASALLRQMQTQRQPIAIVVDESGGVSGLVTIEDLVEELVGDILSENEPAPAGVRREADGSVVLPATMPIRDASRLLEVELPEPEGFTTLAGLCLHLAHRIPEAGAKLELPNAASLEVVDASMRRVRVVRFRPPPPGAEQARDSEE